VGKRAFKTYAAFVKQMFTQIGERIIGAAQNYKNSGAKRLRACLTIQHNQSKQYSKLYSGTDYNSSTLYIFTYFKVITCIDAKIKDPKIWHALIFCS
jgi:hypothetical protein